MKKIFSLKTLLIINAIFTAAGGLGQILIPEQWVGTFIPNMNASAAVIAQFMGVVVLSVAVVSYLARNVKDKSALRAILAGFAVMNLGSLLLVAYGMSTGLMSEEGFGDVVIHGLFAASFVYFFFKTNRALASE